ncbi:unnamed protein product [Polarella glacialis]|uniref:Radial spoke head protein 9 homolog n=1 Tax=Polarella glacialis TaxID=89957 RepID=A0A813G3B0_POLGL|nr:unnamed protein product [Polarella glacialis]CAE8688607.1 unnamed protein product [Polarella glacialis]
MENQDLETGLKYCAAGGQVLNCQEIAGLSGGLALLKSKEQFQRIYFWGKVFGQTADYYVAYGLRNGDFEFPTKHFFFSGKEFQFNALMQPTQEEADRIVELCGDKPLTGAAGTQLEPPKEGEEEPQLDENGEPIPVQGPKKLTEADRLARLVQEIDFDTAAVPKGAHTLSASHSVVAANDFKGLTSSDAAALTSYVHYRAPVSIAALRTLARVDAQAHAGNILDGLDGDQPKGCWAVRKDSTSDLVTLRSLSWPGYIAFHVPETKKFGGIYFGYAQKCYELPFLL